MINNFKKFTLSFAASAALYLTGCVEQQNYLTTPTTYEKTDYAKQQKVAEKAKALHKLNIQAIDGADIKIDNTMSYMPNIELKEGKHTITVSKQGYEDESISVDLESDKNITVKLNKSFNFDGVVNWTVGDDFAGGYFDVFYENGLFYALPSIYANNLESSMITNWQNPQNCNGRKKENIENLNLISVDRKEIKSGELTQFKLYRNNHQIGVFSDITIDGIKNWRLPTLDEARKNSRLLALGKALCYDIHVGVRFPRYDFPQWYSGIDAVTYTKGRKSEGYDMPVSSSLDVAFSLDNKNREPGIWRFKDRTSGYFSHIVPVREPSYAEKIAFDDKSLNATQRIKKYAIALAKSDLTPKMKTIQKPNLISISATMPHLTKGEFETTADFEKRKAQEVIKFEKSQKDMENQNLQKLKTYEEELTIAEDSYKEQEKLFATENYRAKVYKTAIQKGIQIVLGKPYLKDFKYDADKQKMSATLFSPRDDSFTQKVELDVPLSVAKTFKDDLKANRLIPLVELDNNLKIVNVKAVTNTGKLKIEFDIAKSINSIQAYEEFIAKYTTSELAKEAAKNISKLQEEKKQAELKRIKDAQERAKKEVEQKEAEQKAYLAKKQVGEKVCKNGRMAFGLIGVTIKAYVENINGDSIQIRISDTEGQDISYDGGNLYTGKLIWDKYYEWKKCN